MSIYDKAKWHSEGDFPKGLPDYQSFVHIGLYLGWAVERGLAGELLADDFTDDVSQFLIGDISGARLLQITNGVLDDQMLSDEGNEFTSIYYEDAENGYYSDYEAVFPKAESLYHVEDTLDNFKKIKTRLDMRLDLWRSNKPKRKA